MKIQVLGIGSTILCDDGVGIHVIERLRKEVLPANVILTEAGTGGVALLDLIEEVDLLIIIDAIKSGTKPGTVHELSIEELYLRTPAHLVCSHDFDLVTILALGKHILDKKIPPDVVIIAVEASDTNTFSDSCTPEVTKAVDMVVKRVKEKCL